LLAASSDMRKSAASLDQRPVGGRGHVRVLIAAAQKTG
jgi:hypothetical protein